MVVRLVAVPFVLAYVAVEFIMEGRFSGSSCAAAVYKRLTQLEYL